MLAGAKKRKADFTDVVMYVAIATKHLRTIILLILFALTAGLLYYIFSRPVYASKSFIKFAAIGTPAPDVETVKGLGFNAGRWLTEFEAAHIVRKTDEALGNKPGKGKKERIKQVRAVFNDEGDIELSVAAYDHTLVRTFARKMVEVFKEYEASKMTEQNRAEIAKLDEQHAKLVASLAAQETNRANQLNQFDAVALANQIVELRTVPGELERLRLLLHRYEEIRLKLQNNARLSDSERISLLNSFQDEVGDVGASFIEIDDKTKQSLSPAARPANGTVILTSNYQRGNLGEELERKRLTLDRTIKEKSAIWRPGHDKMKQLLQEQAQIEKALKEELSASLARFEINGLKLHARYRRLDAQFPQYRLSKERYDEYVQKKNLLDRGDIDYTSMIAAINRRKADILLGSNTERVKISFDRLEHKDNYDIPVSPNRFKVTLMFLGIGIALALGVPFLLEFMDQTVTNVEKMEEATNIRGLGLIPDFEDTVSEAYPLIFSEGVANPDLIENFRVVRTNLLSSAATSKFPQVIMITSTSPKEGKTVVASNLAMSFAHMGEKTLILDANLRRGIQHHLFGSRSSPGLSNVLVEKYDVADACRPTTMENLHILPSGDQLEGDIEQLGSPQFIQMIDQLRKRYQRIIVDSPPVLGLAETSVMQPAVDGVMLVIWSGQTPTRAVRTAMEILEANHANFYGFVLNRLDLMATMNRFHYYYYTNHYYNRYQSVTRTKGA
jgi:capsular exopolysaccharide synthesis family protein